MSKLNKFFKPEIIGLLLVGIIVILLIRPRYELTPTVNL